MSCDAECEGDDDEVLYDVLPFEGRCEETLPGNTREEDEWHECRHHMESKESDSESRQSRNKKSDTYDHLIDSEQHDERIECHEWQRPLEETTNERICRTRADELQYAKPEEDDEQSKSSGWYAYFSQKTNNPIVDSLDIALHRAFHSLYHLHTYMIP